MFQNGSMCVYKNTFTINLSLKFLYTCRFSMIHEPAKQEFVF
jgi:hypothetical protein